MTATESAIQEIIQECKQMQDPPNTKRTSKFNRGWKAAAYNIELTCNIILGRIKYKATIKKKSHKTKEKQ